MDAMPATAIWRRALDEVDRLAALEETQRAEALAQLREQSAELHGCVLALMTGTLGIEPGSLGFAMPAPQALPPADLAGQSLGPWRFVRLLGTGGMGQVWLAERSDGRYQGAVAIKLLMVGGHPAWVERFQREGQLLGRLAHPHIARLLDAGTWQGGQPYLVLEYVDGQRIDQWCDERQLSVEARLHLFAQVCAAVAHAHASLVVHRDLKPSNIMVTQDSGVKLLDFGIAKLVQGDEGADDTALTREGGRAMTPEYAAPEQVAGLPITTATDVYALGVLLYRLLSGQRPYGHTATTAAQWAREVAETEPMSFATADLAAGAAARSSTPERLRRALRGDLDTIVGKALKKNPAERYASVQALADDLQRWLRHEPVLARPDSLNYRLRRYVRRHAVGVGAAALVLVAVVAGVASTLIKEREAQRQAERAVAVKRFLLELFEQSRTAVKSGGKQARVATVDDMLAAGASRVAGSFPAQPEIRDELFETLVDLYSETSDQERMTSLARQRLVAARQGFGAEDVRTVPAETMLAGVDVSFGASDEARQLLTHAQGLLDRAGDHDSRERAHLLYWQGAYAQNYEPGRPWPEHPMRRAVALFRERHASDDQFLEALLSASSLACKAGQADEGAAMAEELQRRAVARYGTDTLFTAMAMAARGNLLMRSGHPAEALPVLDQAIAGFGKFVGPQSQDVLLAQVMQAEALVMAGRAEDGQRQFDDVRQAVQREHADDARLVKKMARHAATLDKLKAGQPLRCGEQ